MSSALRCAFALSAIVLQVAAADPAAGVHRFTLGKLEVTCLQDGTFQLPITLLKGIDPKDAMAMLDGKDKAPTPVMAYLVKTPHKLVLVDTGAGKESGDVAGHLPERLKAAGVDPAQINLILITHFHMDHVGGLLNPDGTRAFPNAVVRLAQAENDFWTGDPSKMPEMFRSRIPKIKATIAPYLAAGAYKPFAPGENLGEGIGVLPIPGHTPGHSAYTFTSEGKELWCVGDLLHFGAIQFQLPAVAVGFDTDSPQAIASRQELFRKAAKAHACIAGAHLAFPGVFQLQAKGDGYIATPAK